MLPLMAKGASLRRVEGEEGGVEDVSKLVSRLSETLNFIGGSCLRGDARVLRDRLLDVDSQLRDVLPEPAPVLPVRRQVLRAIVQRRMLLLQEADLPLEAFSHATSSAACATRRAPQREQSGNPKSLRVSSKWGSQIPAVKWRLPAPWWTVAADCFESFASARQIGRVPSP